MAYSNLTLFCQNLEVLKLFTNYTASNSSQIVIVLRNTHRINLPKCHSIQIDYIIALLWDKLRQEFELFSQQVYDKKVAPADWVISDVWRWTNEGNLE